MFNGATVHGITGTKWLRHPAEIPLLVAAAITTFLGYFGWFGIIAWLASSSDATGVEAEVRSLFLDGGTLSQAVLVIPLFPLIVWIIRAVTYAQLRANSVQMSPTQFPEGYRMVVEAAQEFGLRRVPDAYVVLGNGQINAFAAGHGFRRFVAVYSDLFEIGGQVRDPEALRFIIGHEVGHLAAGHVSYLRLIFSQLVSYVPFLGQAFSRAQEYTADNHGYAYSPEGVPGAMGVLSGGKYLGAEVNTHALADRATREKGFWLHMSNWLSTHPINTWRAHALRDRSRPGRIMIRPPESTAWFPPSAPSGSGWSDSWPTPQQMRSVLDSTTTSVPSEEQFGRYPGVAYETPRNELRWASPVPVSVGTEPAGQAVPAPAEAQHLESYGYTPSAGREGGLAGDSSAAPSAPPAAEDRGGWPGQA
ncbi:M48 family metallopeptidase [Actinomyces naeslundii]|uniref:M48 family metallopeptidase n=1 Tax=Actinomyces naeslundii TaxID=1655 RepID=UPI00094D0D29|nr:M48 family metallopeptidase [Actinomyces naeslundii]OLO92802.1 peptidase M48 [Actinomyces naeslundii]OMG24234.1 peptidase M48 [Actinomyces naeslundii]OMG34484.1 peptidase M48 [Actinomyces naeslundii]BDH77644.1 peptidase [Actinomyces naeslundii]